jgi:hypothetical protein
MICPVCRLWRERRVTIAKRERQLMLTRIPHTCGAPWLAPKNSRVCTMRAARHTIVLISLARGQHSWRLPWSCCNPLLYVFSAPCKCNSPDSTTGSARFGLTAAPQAIIASLHADNASVFVFMTAFEALHSMHVCNAGAARQAEWRARDAMWPASYALLARKPCLVDPPPPAQHMRAQVSRLLCAVAASPISKCDILYCAVAICVSGLLYYPRVYISTPESSARRFNAGLPTCTLRQHMIRTTQGTPRCALRPTAICTPST